MKFVHAGRAGRTHPWLAVQGGRALNDLNDGDVVLWNTQWYLPQYAPLHLEDHVGRYIYGLIESGTRSVFL